MEPSGHAHIFAGDAGVLPEVLALVAELGVDTLANPDLYVREYKNFGIDDAIELRDRASLGAVGNGPTSPRPRRAGRVFIIIADGMTSEAQNALLKTLEEPPGDARFFFIVPSPEMLLATLRSRAQIVHSRTVRDVTHLVDPDQFLRATPAKRIDILKPLLEKGDDDRRDLGVVVRFLAALEERLAIDPVAHREGLEAIYRARKYLGDRGALIKPLLEQTALLTPVL